MTGRSGGRGGILLSAKVNPNERFYVPQLHVLDRAVSAPWSVSVHNPCVEGKNLGVELLVCFFWSVFLIP